MVAHIYTPLASLQVFSCFSLTDLSIVLKLIAHKRRMLHFLEAVQRPNIVKTCRRQRFTNVHIPLSVVLILQGEESGSFFHYSF